MPDRATYVCVPRCGNLDHHPACGGLGEDCICACGKPASHLLADTDSPDWPCRLPDPDGAFPPGWAGLPGTHGMEHAPASSAHRQSAPSAQERER